MHGDAEFGHHLPQQGAAGLVQLLGHQPWRQFDDVGAQAERAEGVGGFQSQQTAADDDPGGRAAGPRVRRASARIASRSSRVR